MFTQAYEYGGLEAVRAKFDEASNLQEVTIDQLAPALYGVAKRFFDTGNPDVGLAIVEWTAEADGNKSRAHTQMGSAHGLFGDKVTAVEHLERALELAPDDEKLRHRLAGVKAYRSSGSPDGR